MMNHKGFSVSRILTPIALAFALAACESTPQAPASVDITTAPILTVQNYLINADSSKGSLQNDWLIMATKAALANNDYTQADNLIQRLARQTLTEPQQAEWQLARAQLHFRQNQPQKVIELLNFKPWWKLVPSQWKGYHELRAESLQRLGQYFAANREWVAFSQFVPERMQADAAQMIWRNFSYYSANDLNALTTSADEAELDGWLQLAIYMQNLGGNVPQLKNTLQQWLAENPTHGAARFTPADIQSILALEMVQPSRMALLLPLSGKFAKQAQLIRDGFIFAMMNESGRDEEASLTVIDTNGVSAAELARQLQEAQVDFIVGPLIKENIDALTAQGITVPSLALNIPSQIMSGSSQCYFALSPEQEVEQAAKHLFQQGYQYPLILAPKGGFGQRVVSAFNREWQRYSQNPVAVNYFGDSRQLQRNINEVFGLQESQQRIAQMSSLLDLPLETQARSRRDIDAVYIVSKSDELILIKPFIEVAINPDVKPPQLFANSRSNNGGQQLEDLSGIIFSDIPMLNSPNPNLDAQLDTLWPTHSNVEKRLQALGMDAYRLTEQLPQMKVVENYRMLGQTGVLSIDENCIVQREISWKEYGAL
ncbi:YraN family protein [Vibrio sp. SM6]|uniref:Penicillin-binding protein activator LpoA n=1 Tax=Vibrio agarilyticus TaxID=2726741 RepID=A0A7X8TP34_9VIBR|nr:penicillin-binding protein activator [Vibrio agarilyticus]NLS12306.1 YraN family protein [Vibrio agarilyticus]